MKIDPDLPDQFVPDQPPEARSAIDALPQVRGITLANDPDLLQRRVDRGEIVRCRHDGD
ncbi:hypothetical protein [Burkholderia sp. IMCC1007]|uniref:hypothetical protein n=1 Tax=Burkholderia sp. IMCC1007 TaxID=3004104 RepID=UPI0022B330C9|nr:hypothetical protein [Burkholderia sp. IMCC1007]